MKDYLPELLQRMLGELRQNKPPYASLQALKLRAGYMFFNSPNSVDLPERDKRTYLNILNMADHFLDDPESREKISQKAKEQRDVVPSHS